MSTLLSLVGFGLISFANAELYTCFVKVFESNDICFKDVTGKKFSYRYRFTYDDSTNNVQCGLSTTFEKNTADGHGEYFIPDNESLEFAIAAQYEAEGKYGDVKQPVIEWRTGRTRGECNSALSAGNAMTISVKNAGSRCGLHQVYRSTASNSYTLLYDGAHSTVCAKGNLTWDSIPAPPSITVTTKFRFNTIPTALLDNADSRYALEKELRLGCDWLIQVNGACFYTEVFNDNEKRHTGDDTRCLRMSYGFSENVYTDSANFDVGSVAYVGTNLTWVNTGAYTEVSLAVTYLETAEKNILEYAMHAAAYIRRAAPFMEVGALEDTYINRPGFKKISYPGGTWDLNADGKLKFLDVTLSGSVAEAGPGVVPAGYVEPEAKCAHAVYETLDQCERGINASMAYMRLPSVEFNDATKTGCYASEVYTRDPNVWTGLDPTDYAYIAYPAFQSNDVNKFATAVRLKKSGDKITHIVYARFHFGLESCAVNAKERLGIFYVQDYDFVEVDKCREQTRRYYSSSSLAFERTFYERVHCEGVPTTPPFTPKPLLSLEPFNVTAYNNTPTEVAKMMIPYSMIMFQNDITDSNRKSMADRTIIALSRALEMDLTGVTGTVSMSPYYSSEQLQNDATWGNATRILKDDFPNLRDVEFPADYYSGFKDNNYDKRSRRIFWITLYMTGPKASRKAALISQLVAVRKERVTNELYDAFAAALGYRPVMKPTLIGNRVMFDSTIQKAVEIPEVDSTHDSVRWEG